MDEREKIKAALEQGSKAFGAYFRSELRKALDSGKGHFGTKDTKKNVIDFIADALIAANIGDVTELKERAGSEIKSCYKEIAEKRDETAKLRKQLKRAQNAAKKQKRRAEVAERALIIMAEKVLEYAQKAKVTATTSDGMFGCEKDVQLALLANDALLKAEQQIVEEKKEGKQ